MDKVGSDIIVGLDIGTTKICAIVGRRNEYGKIEIMGMGKSVSTGVNRGVVINIDRTVEAIEKAVAEASEASSVQIKSVIAGIAGQHIQSLQHRGMITRTNPSVEITREDTDRLTDDMYKLAMRPGYAIVHVLPQEYTVDDESGIKDPIGMSGVRLEASFHIITGQTTAAQNIERCVKKSNLEVTDMVLEPIASSLAVLGEDEKEAGIALVDIGGGTTDIAIFYDGIIRHTAVIPFGGNIITEDIREGVNVMRPQAELLKIKFGSASPNDVSSNEIVSIPGLRGREPKEISLLILSKIIHARLIEIIDLVHHEIKISGFEKKLVGIVLTGGGSLLKNIIPVFELRTGLDVRIGTPNEYLSKSTSEIKSPMYATAIGLVIQGLNDAEAKQKHSPVDKTKTKANKAGFFDSIIKKSKDYFLDNDSLGADDFKEN